MPNCWWDGSTPLTPSNLIERTDSWSLAADSATATLLQSLSKKVVTKAKEVEATLRNVCEESENLKASLANTNNAFLLLSTTQFIENKSNIDDDSMQDTSPSARKMEFSEDEVLASYQRALLAGTHLVKNALEKHEISDSDSEEDSPRSCLTVYKRINPYERRKLPHIIGSKEFHTDDTLGLKDPSTTYAEPYILHSSGSETEEERLKALTDHTVKGISSKLEDDESDSGSDLGVTAIDISAKGNQFPPLSDMKNFISGLKNGKFEDSDDDENSRRKYLRPSEVREEVTHESPRPPSLQSNLSTEFPNTDGDGLFPTNINTSTHAAWSSTKKGFSGEKTELFDSASCSEDERNLPFGEKDTLHEGFNSESNSKQDKKTESPEIRKPIGGINIFNKEITKAIQRQHLNDSTQSSHSEASESLSSSLSAAIEAAVRHQQSVTTKPETQPERPRRSPDSSFPSQHLRDSSASQHVGEVVGVGRLPILSLGSSNSPSKKLKSIFDESDDDELFGSSHAYNNGSNAAKISQSSHIFVPPPLPSSTKECGADARKPNPSQRLLAKKASNLKHKPPRDLFDSSSSSDESSSFSKSKIISKNITKAKGVSTIIRRNIFCDESPPPLPRAEHSDEETFQQNEVLCVEVPSSNQETTGRSPANNKSDSPIDGCLSFVSDDEDLFSKLKLEANLPPQESSSAVSSVKDESLANSGKVSVKEGSEKVSTVKEGSGKVSTVKEGSGKPPDVTAEKPPVESAGNFILPSSNKICSIFSDSESDDDSFLFMKSDNKKLLCNSNNKEHQFISWDISNRQNMPHSSEESPRSLHSRLPDAVYESENPTTIATGNDEEVCLIEPFTAVIGQSSFEGSVEVAGVTEDFYESTLKNVISGADDGEIIAEEEAIRALDDNMDDLFDSNTFTNSPSSFNDAPSLPSAKENSANDSSDSEDIFHSPASQLSLSFESVNIDEVPNLENSTVKNGPQFTTSIVETSDSHLPGKTNSEKNVLLGHLRHPVSPEKVDLLQCKLFTEESKQDLHHYEATMKRTNSSTNRIIERSTVVPPKIAKKPIISKPIAEALKSTKETSPRDNFPSLESSSGAKNAPVTAGQFGRGTKRPVGAVALFASDELMAKLSQRRLQSSPVRELLSSPRATSLNEPDIGERTFIESRTKEKGVSFDGKPRTKVISQEKVVSFDGEPRTKVISQEKGVSFDGEPRTKVISQEKGVSFDGKPRTKVISQEKVVSFDGEPRTKVISQEKGVSFDGEPRTKVISQEKGVSFDGEPRTKVISQEKGVSFDGEPRTKVIYQEKGVSFDGEPRTKVISQEKGVSFDEELFCQTLKSINKDRPRIQHYRKPPSRVKKASSLEGVPHEEALPSSKALVDDDSILSFASGAASPSKLLAKGGDISHRRGELPSREPVPEPPPAPSLKSPTKKLHPPSLFDEDDDDDDDLFRNSSLTKIAVDSKQITGDTKVRKSTGGVVCSGIESLFSDEEDDDLFGIKVETPKSNTVDLSGEKKGVASGEKGVTSGDKGVASGDKGVASGDKGVASGDKGVASGDRGVAVSKKKSILLFSDDESDDESEDLFSDLQPLPSRFKEVMRPVSQPKNLSSNERRGVEREAFLDPLQGPSK